MKSTLYFSVFSNNPYPVTNPSKPEVRAPVEESPALAP